MQGEYPVELIEVLQRHFSELVHDPDARNDVEELVAAAGDAPGALLYSALFCPPLIEIDGMVIQQIQKGLPPEDYAHHLQDHLATAGGNRKEVECAFNLVFVRNIFVPDRSEMSEQEELLLTRTLAEAWRAWIHWRYPGRRFTFEVIDAEEGGDVMAITFYEER